MVKAGFTSSCAAVSSGVAAVEAAAVGGPGRSAGRRCDPRPASRRVSAPADRDFVAQALDGGIDDYLSIAGWIEAITAREAQDRLPITATPSH